MLLQKFHKSFTAEQTAQLYFFWAADTLLNVSLVWITEAETPVDRSSVRSALDAALADEEVSRVIVRPEVEPNPDAYLAAVLAALMRSDRLDVEVAYVAPVSTRGTKNYGLPHGAAAVSLAESGSAVAVPLIRDDAATVLVGYARHLGHGELVEPDAPEEGEPAPAAEYEEVDLHGETYVDSEQLFTGETRGVRIEPLPQAPGVRARLDRKLPWGGWLEGRAVQTGGTNILVEREGVITQRSVKRSTFYRHHVDLLLVGVEVDEPLNSP